MADFDPFDALRDAGRNAVVPEATAVRARGRQRQQRQRVLYAATAVAVLVGGVSAGVAVAGGGSSASINPPATQGPTLIATEEPAPTETPSAEPTSTPTEAPSSTATPSAPSPTSQPTPHVEIQLSLTNVSRSGLTFHAQFTGLVPQTYDYGTAGPPGPTQPVDLKYEQARGTFFTVDGVQHDGTDGGAETCDVHARLVPVHGTFETGVLFRHNGTPIELAPGRHVATWHVEFCAQGAVTITTYEKSVSFTVS